MGKDNRRVALLDETDLEALIKAYAEKFYKVIEDLGTGVVTDHEVLEIVKKLYGFVREYEALIAEKNEPVAV